MFEKMKEKIKGTNNEGNLTERPNKCARPLSDEELEAVSGGAKPITLPIIPDPEE